MFIQATTIKIPSEEVNSNDTNSKLGSLSLKDKMADTLSTFMSELVISIVVAIFTQLIKIKSLECLSGFCYHDKSKASKNEVY
jgi:hypothetical protein